MVESYSDGSSMKTELQLPFEDSHLLGQGFYVGNDHKEIRSCPFLKVESVAVPVDESVRKETLSSFTVTTTQEFS